MTADGDYHIYVHVDPQYYWMIYYRDSNYVKLCEGSGAADTFAGDLNVEEVCKGAVTTTGPLGTVETDACINFNDTVYLPNIGEYVQVTGPFIYDTVHCWNELHPVSHMILHPAGISGPDESIIDGLKIFPQPANNEMTFQFAHPPHAITLVKLYNIAGQQLFVYALAETSLLKVDVSTWPPGEYLYSIVSQENSKTLKSGKFSVVH